MPDPRAVPQKQNTVPDKLHVLLDKYLTRADETHRNARNFVAYVKATIEQDGFVFEIIEWRGYIDETCPFCGRPETAALYGITLKGLHQYLCSECVEAFVPTDLQVEVQAKNDKANAERAAV